MELFGLKSSKYLLENTSFSGGGEGDIYNIIGLDDKCAKIYHSNIDLSETEAKLKVMLNSPPDSSVLSQIAWPLDLLYTVDHKFKGFIMPKIKVSDELIAVYEYPPTKYQKLTFEHKMMIAQNICAVIDAVHNAGFVFGDFNPNNIGVDMHTGHVAFWDTDSYHIKDIKTGITYRCKVCLDGYVAPELIEKCKKINPQTGKKYNYENAPLETFTKETDNFALAIHIFRIFMNGFTPFAGISETKQLDSTVAPGVGNMAIERDQYCYKPGNIHLSKAVPDKSVLPSGIIRLFDRAFIDGRIDPFSRPNAIEWYKEIDKFYSALVQCRNNPNHQYFKGLKKCPWCEIDKTFNVGISNARVNAENENIIIANAANSHSNISNYANTINTDKRRMIFKEIIVLIVAVGFVIGFYVFDSLRWKNKLIPESYKNYTNVVEGWQIYKVLYFSGNVSVDSPEDEYSVTIEKGSSRYSDTIYEIEIDTMVSNNDKVEIQVTGGSKETFKSDESNDWLGDGYTISMKAGQEYKIKVIRLNKDADYVLRLKRD